MKVSYEYDENELRRQYEQYQTSKGREVLRKDNGDYVWSIIESGWQVWKDCRNSINVVIPNLNIMNQFEFCNILEDQLKSNGISYWRDVE